MTRIVIADPTRAAYAQAAHEVLAEPGWEVVIAPNFDDGELTELADDCDVLITRRRPIPAEFLARARRVRSIQHIGAQPRAEVVPWATERGIPIDVTPSLGNIAVAEQAMTLMLGVSRRVIAGHLGVTTGRYRERGLVPRVTSEVQIAFQWLDLQGISLLYGKTLGIVGFGDIGQALGRMARGFGMRVLYHRRTRLSPEVEAELGVAYRDLDPLVAEVDYLSLHVPHTDETERLIDGRRLAAMKPGAYLINVSRGGVVDEAALVEALRSGHLAGAGLDVFVEEPVPHDHPLLALDNVCLSPHLGSAPARGLGESLALVKPKIQRRLAT